MYGSQDGCICGSSLGLGKTDTFFNRCIKRCFADGPMEYVYVSPDYGLAKEQYERLCASLEGFIRRAVGQPKPRIDLSNGSRIHLRSFDHPKRARGLRRIAEVWVDEIQDIAETHFWSVLRPMLSDVRGTLIVSGQFRGFNWFYKKFFEPGQQPNQSYAKSWRLPSETGLIFQDAAGKKEIEDARKDLTKLEFDQEYGCVPIANQAAVFLPEDLAVIKRGNASEFPEDGHRYLIGYDLGEMSDPSSMAVFDIETRTFVHAIKIPLRQKHDVQAKALGEAARRWNDATVVIDGSSGATGGRKAADENVKHYRKYIPDVHVMVWEPSVKSELVRRSVLAVEGHEISVPASLELMHQELAAYEYKKQGEAFTYKGSDGEHDDQVAAFMMVIWGLKSEWFPDREAYRGPM